MPSADCKSIPFAAGSSILAGAHHVTHLDERARRHEAMKPVPRDENMFSRLAPDPPAVIPKDATMTLNIRTAREIMNERLEWLNNSHECPTCRGHGRVANT